MFTIDLIAEVRNHYTDSYRPISVNTPQSITPTTSARTMGPFPFYLPVLLDISNSIFEVAHSLGGISPVRKIRIENDSWNPKKVWTFCFSPSFCLWCSSALIFMIPICSLGYFHGSDIWPCLPTDSNAVHCFQRVASTYAIVWKILFSDIFPFFWFCVFLSILWSRTCIVYVWGPRVSCWSSWGSPSSQCLSRWMCTSSSGRCPRREGCGVTTVESQPFTDAALCHIDLFSIVSDRIPSNHKKMRSSNTSLLDQTTRHTDLPVSSSNTRIPKDQKSTLKLWPLLRMISGATYSGVPQKVQVFWPHRIFLAKPKSTWKAKDPLILIHSFGK